MRAWVAVTDKDWYRFLPLSGKRIRMPGRDENQPGREFLEWHADAVYRG